MTVHCVSRTAYAAGLLSVTGRFVVSARFASVVNLICREAVLSVQNERIPVTPLSLILTGDEFQKFLRTVTEQTVFRSDPDGLRSGGIALMTVGAPVLSCRFPDVPAALPEAALIRFFRQAVYTMAVPDSLAFVALAPCRCGDGVFNAMQNMAASCLGDRRGMPPALLVNRLSELVGLGEGLTPAGDDFLIGVLSALWFFRDSMRAAADLLQLLTGALSPQLGKSPLVSRAFLARAIEGEFSRPALDLYRCLSAGDRHGLLSVVAQLRGIGHSSGSDMLGGILYGLETLEQLN